MKGVIEYRHTENEMDKIQTHRYISVLGFIHGHVKAGLKGAHTVLNHKQSENIKPVMKIIKPIQPDIIQIGLSEAKAKKLFEAQFGKDKVTRTRRQWKNLVKIYGMETVMETDNMNKTQVKAKCKN